MINSSIDLDNQLVVHVCTGVVTPDEVMEAIRAFYAFDATRDTLWDFTATSEVTVSTADIHRIADLTTSLAQARPDGRTALVATADFTYELSRLYQTLAELAEQTVDVRVFRTVSDAQAWLQSQRPTA